MRKPGPPRMIAVLDALESAGATRISLKALRE
jgi:hypothetical protein